MHKISISGLSWVIHGLYNSIASKNGDHLACLEFDAELAIWICVLDVVRDW